MCGKNTYSGPAAGPALRGVPGTLHLRYSRSTGAAHPLPRAQLLVAADAPLLAQLERRRPAHSQACSSPRGGASPYCCIRFAFDPRGEEMRCFPRNEDIHEPCNPLPVSLLRLSLNTTSFTVNASHVSVSVLSRSFKDGVGNLFCVCLRSRPVERFREIPFDYPSFVEALWFLVFDLVSLPDTETMSNDSCEYLVKVGPSVSADLQNDFPHGESQKICRDQNSPTEVSHFLRPKTRCAIGEETQN